VGLYVASTTVTQPQCANTTVLSGELANDLVDQMDLVIFPAVVGQGSGCSPTAARTERSSWSNRGPPPGGVTIQVYRLAGRRHTEGAMALPIQFEPTDCAVNGLLRSRLSSLSR
jgi:hypothetical protein